MAAAEEEGYSPPPNIKGYVFFGHSMCNSSRRRRIGKFETGIEANIPFIEVPKNVIIVSVGNIGNINVAAVQESFRKIAVRYQHILYDPIRYHRQIEHAINFDLRRLRDERLQENNPTSANKFKDIKLSIADGRIPGTRTVEFVGTPYMFTKYTSNVTNYTTGETVDKIEYVVSKSGLYELPALALDTKPIYDRLFSINGIPTPSLSDFQSLFGATNASGSIILGSEAIKPSQVDRLYARHSLHDPTKQISLEEWNNRMNLESTLTHENLFSIAEEEPSNLHIFYLPTCRIVYLGMNGRETRASLSAADNVIKQSRRLNKKQTKQATKPMLGAPGSGGGAAPPPGLPVAPPPVETGCDGVGCVIAGGSRKRRSHKKRKTQRKR